MVPVEGGEAAPWWVQAALGIAGIGSFLGMLAAAFRPKKDEVVGAARAVTESVSIVDDKPMRSAFEHVEAYLKRIADNTDTMVALDRKRMEEDERQQIRAEARQEAQERESRDRINDRLQRIERAEREQRRRDED